MAGTHDFAFALWFALASRIDSAWGAWQLAAVVAMVATILAHKPTAARRIGWSMVAGLPCAVAGALLLDPLLRLPGWLSAGAAAPIPVGGICAYGALAGLVVGVALAARARRESVSVALDLLAPGLGVLVALARCGCFAAGCDFGAPTRVPWAVYYGPDTPAFGRHLDAGWIGHDAAHALPVHPTQLYEAAVGLAMVAVAWLADRARRRGELPRGAVFAATAATYAVGRSVVEVFRGDVSHATSAITTAQWLGMVVVACVIAWGTERRDMIAS